MRLDSNYRHYATEVALEGFADFLPRRVDIASLKGTLGKAFRCDFSRQSIRSQWRNFLYNCLNSS